VACSTPTRTSSTPGATNSDGRVFGNILVIGVANDYDGRARFERELATELKSLGINGTAYYSAVGGNKPINRQAIEALVKSDGFDAVLITKVLNRETTSTEKTGSAATKTTRKNGRAVDLFRYEYEELNEPVTLNIGLTVTISSELFAASDGQKVWSVESRISNKEMVSKIVDEAVSTVIKHLKSAGVIA
jgi:hypothetical protein